ncbi:MAG TPA: VOC family protein [Baekduia sp.]
MSCAAERPAIAGVDHVAILVADTETALAHWRDHLGLTVVHQEVNAVAQARMTYLDAGNLLLQLLEPLNPDAPLGRALAADGEGLHHLCFGTDDVLRDAAVAATGDDAPAPSLGSGRGRPSAFVPGAAPNGVRVEFTQSD